MKKIVLILALMMATSTVKANNILYFTYNQAARTVACLNSQDELMIYCGYEDELPTYVLINEVWAEQISSSFYEIWLYGYDAYTGEEIYMPIDLECIYLVQFGKIYSAAQYLRFRTTHMRPTFAWAMPPYNLLSAHPVPKCTTTPTTTISTVRAGTGAIIRTSTITPTICVTRTILPPCLPSPTPPAASVQATTPHRTATNMTTCHW